MESVYQAIQILCVWAIPVLFAVTLHEAAHGWVAHKLGDNTAYSAGRVSANPLKHIDLFGTIIIPSILLLLPPHFIFGWAKPVPVNERQLRRPRRDIVLVALAGPFSNFIMACIWALLLKMSMLAVYHKIAFINPLILMSQAGITINVFLMVLNLIPIPPLDGSRLVRSLLPSPYDAYYNRIEPFGFVILLLLLLTKILPAIILPFAQSIIHFITFIFWI